MATLRDVAREADWGKGPEASSGKPIGAAEITKKRPHTDGAVGVALPLGKPRDLVLGFAFAPP